jgi:hypothetical protein
MADDTCPAADRIDEVGHGVGQDRQYPGVHDQVNWALVDIRESDIVQRMRDRGDP